MAAGKKRRRYTGFLRVEMVILLVVGVMTVTGLSVRAALHLGKPHASAQVGKEVSAGFRATIDRTQGRGAPGSTSTSTPGAAKAAPTTTVPPGSIKWTNTYHQISYGGMTRTYMVAEPTPAPTGKVPLIVVLHGVNANPLAEEQRTGLLPVVGPAILVYPAGYLHTWDAGTCCGAPVGMHLNDVGFVTTVAQKILADYPQTTPSQVYLVGYSLGGKLAWDIACHGTTVFHAVATYGSVPVVSCPKVGPVSAMLMAGTNDPQVSTSDSQPQISVAGFTQDRTGTFAAQLRRDDGCSATHTTQTVGTATTKVWPRCNSGMAVGYVLFAGQDHGWPEGTSTTPSAQQLIWAFFRSLGAT